MRSALDYLVEPGALEARLRWPSFHWGIFRMVSQMRALRVPVDTVIDVGAHTGLFSYAMGVTFPHAMIHAFEPLPECRGALDAVSRQLGVTRMQVWPKALGSYDGEGHLQVSEQAASSSMLEMLPQHWRLFPGTQPIATIPIPVARLDTVAADLALRGGVLLKLDVQGYEGEVLEGARNTLGAVRYVISEVSVARLYAGETRFEPLLDLLRHAGFEFLLPLASSTHPRTGQVIQFDALFVRADDTSFPASDLDADA